jgi:hypothetical protein
MNQLDRFEKLARQLIEGPFQRLFGGHLHPADLAEHLLAAVEAGRRSQNGTSFIPNQYQIALNPADYALLVEESRRETVLAELQTYLPHLAAEADYQFGGPLRVVLTKNDSIQSGRVQVETKYVA